MGSTDKQNPSRRAVAYLCGTCLAGGGLGIAATASAAEPEASFGGQYRINSYSLSSDESGSRDANRLRIRQNIDLDFGDGLTTHLQMELGHTTGNLSTTGRYMDGGNTGLHQRGDGDSLRVRHAVTQYEGSVGTIQAGLLPISDKFGDALHSAAWDWNPLAVAGVFEAGPGKLRVGTGTVSEGDEWRGVDDVGQHLVDYEMDLGGGSSLVLGATQLYAGGPVGHEEGDEDTTVSAGDGETSYTHSNFGVGGKFDLGAMQVNAFVLGSQTEDGLLSPGQDPAAADQDDGSGYAAKLELTGKAGPGDFGLMGTYATGEDDGTGFMPAMGVVGHQGYWGYTGTLTVQGPTDTAIDGKSVNIGNSGYGMATVQAKYSFGITEALDGYVGAGWFGESELNSGDVGTDVILMGTYHFTDVLAWNFGVTHAQLEDGGVGYWSNGLTSGVGTEDKDWDDTRTAAFSRFQAQF